MDKTGNEIIDGAVDIIKAEVIDLMYSEDSKDDFESVVNINDCLKLITTEFKSLETECNRQKSMASKLRKQWGDTFSAECDAAGIK